MRLRLREAELKHVKHGGRRQMTQKTTLFRTATIRRGVAALLMAMCTSGILMMTGCRTAASLGLPVSAGSNTLLPYASKLRQAGHRKGIATELAKQPLPPHRMEAGDVLVIEPNDFNSPVRLQSDQTVQQDGVIELGDYGRLEVLGLTT